MRIEFSQTFKDQEKIKRFVTPQEPVRKVYRGEESYLIGMRYDLRGFEKVIVDKLEDTFKQKGSQTTRYANNELWVEPNRFSLNLDARIQEIFSPHVESFLPSYSQYGNFQKTGNKVINEGIKLLGKRFSRKEIAFYQEIPSILIKGIVDYEDFEKVEPKDVLEILTEQGYTPHIITTTNDVEALVRGLKTKGKLVTK